MVRQLTKQESNISNTDGVYSFEVDHVRHIQCYECFDPQYVNSLLNAGRLTDYIRRSLRPCESCGHQG